MEDYAKSRAKKGKVRSVRVEKAEGGFIVTPDYDIGGENKKVYKDLDGVYKCLQDKFGGKSEEDKEGE